MPRPEAAIDYHSGFPSGESRMPRRILFAVLAALVPSIGAAQSFQNFESALVHPIRVSGDGTLLFVANAPDNRLEVYSLADPASPLLLRTIPVGLEPVSVTPRTNDEVWVTNNLSDSVSIVSVAAGRVVATLAVKDEPADVVFAGTPVRAFVSAMASDAVLVFDPVTRAQVATIPIDGKDPAALARNAAGDRVYALVKRSGNKTTVIPYQVAPAPPPPTNGSLPAAPQQALIVLATNPAWTAQIPYTMPDNDVAEIDATTFAITRYFTGVGTSNFDLAAHPATGTLYVVNTNARNLVRFEPVLRGHAIDSVMTTITTGVTPVVTPVDLNPGVNYGTFPNPAALGTALSEPTGIAIDAAGAVIYVAAGGTDRIAVLDLAGSVIDRIEVGATPGATVDPLAKKGPRALALHPTAPRLYVLNRLSHSLAVIDTGNRTVTAELPLSYDPTPASIKDGRKFLYDAKLSGNGTMSCAACHVDGDIDGLAWDLGDPGGTMQAPPAQPFPFNIGLVSFHPMKGPMTTQTLRGLSATNPLHWRGDRANFQAFNGAFASLMGGSQISGTDMNTYATFGTSIVFPPNPNQNLDRTYTTTPASANAQEGFNTFTTTSVNNTLGQVTCSTCHTLPAGSNNMVVTSAILQEPQQMNVPQFRNVYRKLGFLKAPGTVKSGFGFLHDGVIDTPLSFVNLPVFNPWPAAKKDDLAAFLVEVDTGMAPAVGLQITVTGANANAPATLGTIALLESQAAAGNCGLVVKGTLGGLPRGLVYQTAGSTYATDTTGLGPFTSAALRSQALAGATWTFTGVAPGTANRIGIDRDQDGTPDGVDGVETYGASTAGINGPLLLAGNKKPSIGTTGFALAATGAPANAGGIFAFSALPASIPIAGITALVDVNDPSFSYASLNADGNGTLVISADIPNAAALVGTFVYVQAAAADPSNPGGLSASNGVKVTIRP
jgi:YVTN family beta-propeller protein